MIGTLGMSSMVSITTGSPEALALKTLAESGSNKILNFAQLSKKTGLGRDQVRPACHRLKAANLASYETGGGGYNGAEYMITTGCHHRQAAQLHKADRSSDTGRRSLGPQGAQQQDRGQPQRFLATHDQINAIFKPRR